ncbi:MAG: RNA-binding transcriptional accessory protein [Polyangiaceae bacterium]|nr:RNA-binding transcriptional accessory protein [Polyangiaceae bacterium]
MTQASDSPPAAPAAAAPPFDPVPVVAAELALPRAGVAAVVKLLAEGATVPFIARYRKEATGALDEVQVRDIEEKRAYHLELDERRRTVLAEIGRQGKLTPELEAKVRGCANKAELEDLYLPYKPKRRTRATIARERGLGPLADRMWSQPHDARPEADAAAYVDAAKEVPDAAAALAGARDICAERIAEDASLRKIVRDAFAGEGVLRVGKEAEWENKATKFDMYASFEEPIKDIPSHRYLAVRRGEAEGVLRARIELDPERALPRFGSALRLDPASPYRPELERAMQDAYKRLVAPGVESDTRIDLKLAADRSAVDVFAQNLRQLLLAAPYGERVVIGIDPGQRSGCKVAVVDGTGKLLGHTLLHLVQGDAALARSRQTLLELCRLHRPSAIAVGNGTHGRETQDFVHETLAEAGLGTTLCVLVSEAGASVYSASDVAREEFPDLDLTVRGAVSIARRLQDPLSELVKIDPKSIGVGQYQHDVHQPLLGKKLDEVVESCVNSVGVELNTASAPLLARVAGVGPSLAKKIVAHRDANGPFPGRRALLDVPGLGPRAFEQSAGFLRVRGGEHPLDASAVHPERYPLVEKMARDLGVDVARLVGNDDAVRRIDAARYTGGDVGAFTLNDILAELKKPGRDPRANFEAPAFRKDVRAMTDLTPGMELEGVVTNVTAFGAFVDIGVHQDGLVHVSKLADRFIKDPSEVVKVGDKIRVKVLEIDLERKRISLTARKGDAPPAAGANAGPGARGPGGPPGNRGPGGPPNRGDRRPPPRGDSNRGAPPAKQGGGFSNNPFADLLRNKS